MKKNLFKTCLVAVMAIMGVSTGWAQTVTTYDFEDGNALFSQDSRITVSVVEGTQTIYNQDFAVDGKAVSFKGAGNAQNGYCFSHFDFSSLCAQASKVKVEFDAVLGNGARSRFTIGDASVRGNGSTICSKTTYGSKGAIFMVGTEKSAGYVNGTSNSGLLTSVTQKWMKVTVDVDETAKKYTYSIVDKSTGDVIDSSEEPIAFWQSDATNCTQIDMFGYINNSQMGLIDNLVITVTKDERPHANYTVKFVDENGTEIKEAVTRDGAVGDGIDLLPADMDAFKNADGSMKYFYKEDNSADVTIAADGSSVVIVTYREANVWNYTVSFNSGNLALGQKQGNGFELDQMVVPYPKYLANSGQLYLKDRGVSTANEFNYKFDLTEDNMAKAIEYDVVDGATNVVFCSEAEDIPGLTLCTSSNAGIRSSNSAAAYAATEDVTITNLAAGKYKIHAALFDATTNHSSVCTIKKGELVAATIACTGINFTEYDTDEFAIGKDTDIKLAKGGSGSVGLDLIYIVKTGDVTAEEAAELNAEAEAAEALAAAKADLEAAIAAAELIDTTDKEGADALATAIADAKAALAAEDATTESLKAANDALDEAVRAFEEANKSEFDPSEVIKDADFSSIENWIPVVSGQYRDYGYGLIGTYKVRDEFNPATVDETHLDTEYCLGVEARWSTNYASFTQVTAELPAGAYTLSYDVENVNAGTTKATYENRFTVTVGETTYTDQSTEWMNGKSSWTKHSIYFVVDQPTTAQISLGYGTGNNNYPVAQTPALYISHLGLEYKSLIDGALEQFNEALAAAQEAATDNIVTGEEKDALTAAIAANQNPEQTVEALNAATQALKDAVAAMNAAKPAYEALEQAKNDVAGMTFLYATDAKNDAAEAAAQAVATSAADATAKKDALIQAYRELAESSATLEGVPTAKDMTSYIVNPLAEEAIAEPWTVVLGEGSGGALNVLSNESMTDASGKNDYKYFDGGNWGANAWDVTLKQEINLPKGKYQLTVASRASAEMSSFNLFVNDQKLEMKHIGASVGTGLFDRGWNDASIEFTLTKREDVTIGVQGIAEVIHQWMSFTRFRLFVFDETATGISEVSSEQQNGQMYNLRGQRVQNAQKGLYIQNGKKVIMK